MHASRLLSPSASTGTAGGFTTAANNTNNSGWSAFEYGTTANTASNPGQLSLQRTAGGPVQWRFRTTQNDGIGDTPGAAANFDPTHSYSWLIFRPRTNASASTPTPTNQLNTIATITLLDQNSNPLANNYANLNRVLGFDPSGFIDPNTGNPILASAGTFDFTFGPDLIGRENSVIFLNFTPTPEPGLIFAAGASALALFRVVRRRTL